MMMMVIVDGELMDVIEMMVDKQADLHVHQQVGLLNDIHHLANLLYHHHHYNRGIVPRGALHN